MKFDLKKGDKVGVAGHEVHPKIQIIKAEQINEAWGNVVNKKARYRYVIDAATFSG